MHSSHNLIVLVSVNFLLRNNCTVYAGIVHIGDKTLNRVFIIGHIRWQHLTDFTAEIAFSVADGENITPRYFLFLTFP